MKDDLRAGPEDYKQLAERCAEIASECSAPTVAEALRALAVDYLRRAAKLRRREPIKSRPVAVQQVGAIDLRVSRSIKAPSAFTQRFSEAFDSGRARRAEWRMTDWHVHVAHLLRQQGAICASRACPRFPSARSKIRLRGSRSSCGR